VHIVAQSLICGRCLFPGALWVEASPGVTRLLIAIEAGFPAVAFPKTLQLGIQEGDSAEFIRTQRLNSIKDRQIGGVRGQVVTFHSGTLAPLRGDYGDQGTILWGYAQ